MALVAVLERAVSGLLLAQEENNELLTPGPGPGVRPNVDGLPGLAVLRQIVGALLTWGLLACVAGLVVSVIVWVLGHHNGNYGHTSNGKIGVLVAAGGALLIGAANGIVGFFSGLGYGIG
jgi:Family of unknown function (DUF6112)